ncbi:hypothetical protein MNB_SM-4-1634 [hydrothermal vent metagenome]|uniref:Uncharacterized protein n=1 Tax=hydrothermal vent metagenome TaxID=652676 RepID=A0A1W1BYN5_9ZZZZ
MTNKTLKNQHNNIYQILEILKKYKVTPFLNDHDSLLSQKEKQEEVVKQHTRELIKRYEREADNNLPSRSAMEDRQRPHEMEIQNLKIGEKRVEQNQNKWGSNNPYYQRIQIQKEEIRRIKAAYEDAISSIQRQLRENISDADSAESSELRDIDDAYKASFTKLLELHHDEISTTFYTQVVYANEKEDIVEKYSYLAEFIHEIDFFAFVGISSIEEITKILNELIQIDELKEIVATYQKLYDENQTKCDTFQKTDALLDKTTLASIKSITPIFKTNEPYLGLQLKEPSKEDVKENISVYSKFVSKNAKLIPATVKSIEDLDTLVESSDSKQLNLMHTIYTEIQDVCDSAKNNAIYNSFKAKKRSAAFKDLINSYFDDANFKTLDECLKNCYFYKEVSKYKHISRYAFARATRTQYFTFIQEAKIVDMDALKKMVRVQKTKNFFKYLAIAASVVLVLGLGFTYFEQDIYDTYNVYKQEKRYAEAAEMQPFYTLTDEIKSQYKNKMPYDIYDKFFTKNIRPLQALALSINMPQSMQKNIIKDLEHEMDTALNSQKVCTDKDIFNKAFTYGSSVDNDSLANTCITYFNELKSDRLDSLSDSIKNTPLWDSLLTTARFQEILDINIKKKSKYNIPSMSIDVLRLEARSQLIKNNIHTPNKEYEKSVSNYIDSIKKWDRRAKKDPNWRATMDKHYTKVLMDAKKVFDRYWDAKKDPSWRATMDKYLAEVVMGVSKAFDTFK